MINSAASAVITAILYVSSPNAPEEARAAFFTDHGRELCMLNEQELNSMVEVEGLDIHYRCDAEVRR